MADQPKRAVALRYEAGRDAAPKVVAKGRGAIADQILARARAAGVPVRQDRALVEVLSRLNLDQEIPPAVYQAVAALIAVLYRANRPPG